MFTVIIEAVFIGLGLAMDAAALSMADGLAEPKMLKRKIVLIAICFAFFQGIMPLIGYLAGSIFVEAIGYIAPWLTLAILGLIGIKMIIDSFNKKTEVTTSSLTIKLLLFQALVTSIDALAVGVIFVDQNLSNVLMSIAIIGMVTFIIVFCAIQIGKKLGNRLSKQTHLLGGIILVAIGLKLFLDYFI